MTIRRLAGLLAGSLLLWAAADVSAQGLPPWLEQWQQPSTPEPPRPRRPTQPEPALPPGSVIQPPPTIPSVPLPTPVEMPAVKPAQLFELRLGTDVVEEYSDNFFQAAVHPITNFRTLLVPRSVLFLHGAFLEGVFQTALNTAWDSSVDQYSFFPSTSGQLTAEVTPRWILGLSTAFAQTDNPAANNRLGIDSQRSKSTSLTAGVTSNYALTPLVLRQSYTFNQFKQSGGSTTTGHTAGGGASLTLAQINTLSLDYTHTRSDTSGGGEGDDAGTSGTGTSGTTGGGGAGQKTSQEGNGFVLALSREVSARLVAGASANYAWNTTRQSGGAQDSSGTSSSTSAGGTTTTDFTRWGAGIFGTYTLPGTLFFRGSLGFINLNGSGGVNETVLSTQSSVTYFSGPFTLDAAVESGFSETFQGNSVNFGVVKTQSVSAGAGYAFTPKLIARVGGSYRKNEETGLGGGGTAGNKTAVTTATGSLSWQALPWLAIVADYTYTNSETLDGDSGATATGGGAGGATGTGAAAATGYQENRARISFKFDF